MCLDGEGGEGNKGSMDQVNHNSNSKFIKRVQTEVMHLSLSLSLVQMNTQPLHLPVGKVGGTTHIKPQLTHSIDRHQR